MPAKRRCMVIYFRQERYSMMKVFLLRENLQQTICPINVALFKSQKLADKFVAKHNKRKFYVIEYNIISAPSQFKKVFLQNIG